MICNSIVQYFNDDMTNIDVRMFYSVPMFVTASLAVATKLTPIYVRLAEGYLGLDVIGQMV